MQRTVKPAVRSKEHCYFLSLPFSNDIYDGGETRYFTAAPRLPLPINFSQIVEYQFTNYRPYTAWSFDTFSGFGVDQPQILTTIELVDSNGDAMLTLVDEEQLLFDFGLMLLQGEFGLKSVSGITWPSDKDPFGVCGVRYEAELINCEAENTYATSPLLLRLLGNDDGFD